jgi:hypothetical protein
VIFSWQFLALSKFAEGLWAFANRRKKAVNPIGGTFLILLVYPNSHFSTPESIYNRETQDAEDSFSFAIQCLEF